MAGRTAESAAGALRAGALRVGVRLLGVDGRTGVRSAPMCRSHTATGGAVAARTVATGPPESARSDKLEAWHFPRCTSAPSPIRPTCPTCTSPPVPYGPSTLQRRGPAPP